MTRQAYKVDDFVRAFRASEHERALLTEECAKYDLIYRRPDRAERDGIILGILEKLDNFSRVGSHRSGIWEDHWSNAREAFVNSGGDLSSLDPSFMGAHSTLRLDGDYALAESPQFETYWFRVARRLLFARYLPDVSKAFEFGCGSGFNLAAAALMFPEIELVGLDWSASAVQLVNDIAAFHGFNLKGRRFDFFNPEADLPIDSDTAVLTFAALEQVGSRVVEFAEWLLAQRPAIVLSVEPILENYDQSLLFDYLAIRYHTHRDYLTGYLSWATAQAKAGNLEIVSSFRPGFGSLYHEGYSVLVWRPT